MSAILDDVLLRIEEFGAGLQEDAEEIAAVRTYMDDTVNALAAQIDGVTTAVGAASEAMAEAEQRVEALIADQLDSPIAQAANGVARLRTAVTALVETEGSNRMNEASDEIAAIRERFNEQVETFGSQIGEGFGIAMEALTETEADLEHARMGLEQILTERADEVGKAIEDALMTPLKEEATRLTDSWRAQTEGAVVALMEELFDNANAMMREPLDQALDQITDIVRAEFEALADELRGGDAEGAEQREALDAALDDLKSAFEPLKGAFEQFQSLASTVGIRI